MSKKGSPAPSNTLFKYFSPTPSKIKSERNDSFVSPTSEKLSTPKIKKVGESPKSIINTQGKRSKEFNGKNENTDQDDDEIILQKTKRRRLLIVDSDDSDRENESDNSQGSEKESSKKKSRSKPNKDEDEYVPNEDDESPPPKKIVKKEKTEENISFQDKLDKSIKIEVNEETDYKLEDLVDNEPVAWPHTKLEFLQPNKIKDIKGRRSDHPEYDPRTLYVPESFLAKQSPGMRQWWQLKSQFYDCVLFFKVGKFYEFYHMDASIGVKELGFTYMRGEFAHSGFPEIGYERMASSLIERGYKVARVEQTETPDMMTERCKTMKSVTKHDRVVKREVCQVTNKGTQVFGHQIKLVNTHQRYYMLAIVEKNLVTHSRYGVCFIDTSIGDFHIGEFEDDKQCSRLLTLLSHNPPVLLLFERKGTTPRTDSIFKTMLGNTIRESLATETELWSGGKTLKHLAENYYSDGKWPEVVKSMQDESDHLGFTPSQKYNLALRALGGCIWYLKKCLLDQQTVSMARFQYYIPPDLTDIEKESFKISVPMNKFMILDSITLSNLKITDEENSLLSTVDQCCTKFGKRLLHHWVCSPSCEIEVIRDRQHAITELIDNYELLQEIRLILGTLPDLERVVAQIHTFGNPERMKHHPDGRAIFFEDKIYSKRKINDFVTALNAFESCTALPNLLKDCKSNLLIRISQLEPKGIFPDMEKALNYFKTSFDHEEAKKEGVIAPGDGIDDEYDEIKNEIEEINAELKEYLKTQEKHFGCKVNYFGTEKKRFQIEVPESSSKRAGNSYSLEGQKKGSKPVKRYHTDETRKFCKRMLSAEERKNLVLKDLSRRIFEKFSKYFALWQKCYELVGALDVLTSLAEYARNQGNTCVPEIVDHIDGKPVFELDEGFHPCMNSADFIPNGITLGYPEPSLAILTGPNMGGKSTLMREVGLIAILVQIGSRVPANSCKMSLIDRIFTRLGAQDDIMAGHSTFLVELNETSAILKHATINSLVLLDELGRGTATYDGTAIAASVVNFLAGVGCRTLFSTHYHSLVDNFGNDDRISLGHMSCMVENDDSDDPTQETVTFLYKYADGPCPKSYGFNAAKLAGMPLSIIRRAYELSKNVEATALKRKLLHKIITDHNVQDIEEILLKLKLCSVQK